MVADEGVSNEAGGTAAPKTLVQSSPDTRSWLRDLRDRLPMFGYREAKNWASFRTVPAGTAVAYLNPSKRGIRLFLRLDPTDDSHLRPTPSSSRWAARFPAVFRIVSDQDLPTAAELIAKSCALDADRPVLDREPPSNTAFRSEEKSAEELPSDFVYVEGAAHQVLVNAYERNREARSACLLHYGRSCVVCNFNFEAIYGSAAAGYIQVHHVVPIAKIGKEYLVDPIADLRPVCSNCHAVIHRREPAFSVEEVQQMLRHQ